MRSPEEMLPFMLWTFLLPFLVASALAIWKNGFGALKHSPEMLKSARVNIALMLLNAVLAPIAFIYIDALSELFLLAGVWQLPAGLWASMPLTLCVLVWFFYAEFVDYWIHRVMHDPLLWTCHMVHHSDEQLNMTTTFRKHVLELLIMHFLILTLAGWANAPVEAVLISNMIGLAYNQFVHIDVDIHFGPLNRILATPRQHRWHHAQDPAAYGKNFANTFSFWDTLFGTYYCPGPYKGDVGLGPDGPGDGLLSNVIWPFRRIWQSLKAARPKTDLPMPH